MPTKLRKGCAVPNCPGLTHRQFCQAHDTTKARARDRQRTYGRRWRSYSQRFRRIHPDCQLCGSPATQVDHIHPVSGSADPLFWEPTNHQAFCASCHSRKTVNDGRWTWAISKTATN